MDRHLTYSEYQYFFEGNEGKKLDNNRALSLVINKINGVAGVHEVTIGKDAGILVRIAGGYQQSIAKRADKIENIIRDHLL